MQMGQGSRWAARAVAAAGLGFFVLAGGATAGAEPVGTQFVPTQAPLWSATAADGTTQSSVVTIDAAELAPGGELPGADQLNADQNYFYVALHASFAYSTDPTAPFAMPATSATLLTPNGAVAGIPESPSSYAIDASWYFPVSANLTSVTLDVASFTKVLGNERGDFITWTFSPSPINFVAQESSTTTVPPPAQAVHGQPSHRAGGSQPSATRGKERHQAPGGGMPLGVALGAGLGAVLVLGAAGAGLVSAVRRRAFYRADREGRVVLTGPPLIAGLPTAARLPEGGAEGAGVPPRARHELVVKLLGALEIEGTRRPVRSGPLLELIVYLVLHPGQSFTSVQIRESVWGLGRQPIKPATFRVYMVELRKAFGPGVVVTDKYRYQLTEAVTCDWDQFRTRMQTDDGLQGGEDALALVRGPVLHGCFDGKKNSPFSWAVDTTIHIEDQVTSVAAELAVACLGLDDPARAAKAIAQGLRCATANHRLRLLDLRVGAALGGEREIGRRLAAGVAAMAGFPTDVAELEDTARALGWTAELSG